MVQNKSTGRWARLCIPNECLHTRVRDPKFLIRRGGAKTMRNCLHLFRRQRHNFVLFRRRHHAFGTERFVYQMFATLGASAFPRLETGMMTLAEFTLLCASFVLRLAKFAHPIRKRGGVKTHFWLVKRMILGRFRILIGCQGTFFYFNTKKYKTRRCATVGENENSAPVGRKKENTMRRRRMESELLRQVAPLKLSL